MSIDCKVLARLRLLGAVFFGLFATAVSAQTTTASDCLFNWAEKIYPQLFAPAGATSANFQQYYYRYYAGTGNYLATSSPDNHIWVLGPSWNNSLVDVGPTSSFLATAGCSTSQSGSPAVPRYAYVANANSNNVSQYTIGTGGELSPMTPATVATGMNPYSVTVDPSGKYAYVVNSNSNNVSQYTIGTGGALTPMIPATVAIMYPYSVTVDPSGKYAYVTNSNSDNTGTVSQYTIGSGGTLTPMTPATITAGMGSSSVTIDPSGKHAYVVNRSSNNVSQYIVGTGGALSPMTPATVAAGSIPEALTVDPSGKYAYVANYGSISSNISSVSQYTIGTGGALSPMIPATVATETNSYSVTVDPSGKYAYVTNLGSSPTANGSVSQFTIGSGGALTPMIPATVAAGASPFSVTVDLSGKYAYVTNSNGGNIGSISQYTIGTGGALSPMTPATVAAGMLPAIVITK